jgi:hypothetical protein
MEHHEEVVLISATDGEIDSIHDAISFLQKIQGSFELVFLDEGDGTFIKFGQHDGNLIF